MRKTDNYSVGTTLSFNRARLPGAVIVERFYRRTIDFVSSAGKELLGMGLISERKGSAYQARLQMDGCCHRISVLPLLLFEGRY